MKRKSNIIQLLFLLSLSNLVIAQENGTKTQLKTEDIDNKIISKIITNQFSQIVTGQDRASLNNYISYKTENSKLTFNGTIPLTKNKDFINKYLTINASGAIDNNNIFSAISNSKLNTNTSLEFKIHNLDKKNWNISLASDNYNIFERQKEMIINNYEFKKDSIVYSYQINQAKIDSANNVINRLKSKRKSLEKDYKIKFKILKLQDDINLRRKSIENINITLQGNLEEQDKMYYTTIKLKNIKEIKEKCDSLGIVVKENQSLILKIVKSDEYCSKYIISPDSLLQIDSLLNIHYKKINKFKLNENGKLINLEQILFENENEKDEKINNLRDSFKIEGISIGWGSWSYGISNNKFYLFDSKQMFENQIMSKSFIAHQITYEYSYFKFNNFSNQYSFKIRTSAFLTDNREDELNTKEIVENTKILKDATQERILSKKYTAYVGEYKNNILGLKINGDLYKILPKNNFIGLHFFPELILKKNFSTLNTGIGLFLNFLKKEDVKSNVNVEFYIRFNDLLHNKMTLPFDRNDIGIWLNIPLNFKKF